LDCSGIIHGRKDERNKAMRRLTAIGLATWLMLTSASAFAQGATASNGGLSNEAGSIAAGANSFANPSGNSFLNPPPGISAPVAPVGGVHR